MLSNHLPTKYQEFIHLSRYSRWLPEKGRRETWTETISRYFDFFEDHLKETVNYASPAAIKHLIDGITLVSNTAISNLSLTSSGKS